MTVGEAAQATLDLGGGVAPLLAGWSLVRRGSVNRGTTFIVTGVAWFAGSLLPDLALVHRVPLVAAVLLHGTFRSPHRRWVVLAGSSALAVLSTLWERAPLSVLLGASLLLVAADTRSWGPSARPSRQACAGYGTILLFVEAESWIGHVSVQSAAITYSIAVICIAGLAARAPRAVAERLAIDVGSLAHGASLIDRLRVALGDPYLELIRDSADVEPRRSTTVLRRSGRQVGILCHSPSLHLDDSVIDGVAAIVGLASDAADLRAAAHETLADIDRSSQLLAGARDREAVALAHQVERGPIARIVRAMADVDDPCLTGQLEDAVRELRQVTDGLALTGAGTVGLRAALNERAAASSVPIILDLDDAELPDAVTRALYLVCCEALANVSKHADASCVRVRVRSSADFIAAEVADDGCGGADTSGAGLRGLAARVSLLGGHATIDSPPGRGTRIRVAFPAVGHPT